MVIGLISGSARKLSEATTAEMLYSKSPLFRYSLMYCKKHYDAVYVLSPKHGLLSTMEIVEPYEENLANIQRRAFKDWIDKVVGQINETIPTGSELYILAGNRYRKLIPYLQKDYVCHEPTKGMGIGKQLKWFKEEVHFME